MGKYTPEEIERGLAELAICGGNTRRASRQLRPAGLKVPASTLQSWMERYHTQRYERLRTELVPRIHAKIAQECEDLAQREAEMANQVLERMEKRLPEIPTRELPGALRNLDVGKGVNVDKALGMRGRPTVIVERRDISEHLLVLKELGVLKSTDLPGFDVEGTAVEEEEAKEIEA